MNIYLVSQDINRNYDTYDSFVCIAESEDAARMMHPSKYVTHINNNTWMGTYSSGVKKGQEYVMGNDTWVSVETAKTLPVKLIGIAEPSQVAGIILASFNAG